MHYKIIASHNYQTIFAFQDSPSGTICWHIFITKAFSKHTQSCLSQGRIKNASCGLHGGRIWRIGQQTSEILEPRNDSVDDRAQGGFLLSQVFRTHFAGVGQGKARTLVGETSAEFSVGIDLIVGIAVIHSRESLQQCQNDGNGVRNHRIRRSAGRFFASLKNTSNLNIWHGLGHSDLALTVSLAWKC